VYGRAGVVEGIGCCGVSTGGEEGTDERVSREMRDRLGGDERRRRGVEIMVRSSE
jgi:hypothetical protein